MPAGLLTSRKKQALAGPQACMKRARFRKYLKTDDACIIYRHGAPRNRVS